MAWVSGEVNTSSFTNVGTVTGVDLGTVTRSGNNVSIRYRAWIRTTSSWSYNVFALWVEGNQVNVKGQGDTTKGTFYTGYFTKVVSTTGTTASLAVGVNGKSYTPTSPAGYANFTVHDLPPAIYKPTITNLTTTAKRTSIDASFSITNTGGQSPDTYIDLWSNSGLTENKKSISNKTGTFTNLSPNTSYWLRGNSGNSAGRTYTAVKEVKTTGNDPVINRVSVSPSQTTATFSDNTTYDTNDGFQRVEINYSLVEDQQGWVSDEKTLRDLTPDTTYYYYYDIVSRQGRRDRHKGNFITDHATQQIISLKAKGISARGLTAEIVVPNPTWLASVVVWVEKDGTEVEKRTITSGITATNNIVFNDLEVNTEYIIKAEIRTRGSSTTYLSETKTVLATTTSGHLINKINADGTISGHNLYALGKANKYNPSALRWQNGAWKVSASDIQQLLNEDYYFPNETGACTIDGLPILANSTYTFLNNQAGVKMSIIGTDKSDIIKKAQVELIPGQTHTYNTETCEKLYISISPTS